MQQGYLVFEGIECVYSKFDDCIIIYPKNELDYRKLYQFDHKANFILEYEHFIYKKSLAWIEKISPRFDRSLRLTTKFTVALARDNEINGFILTGDEIDVFFSPSRYFFLKKNSESITSELLYGKEEVNKFKFTFRETNISVSLYYGEILSDGISSDLKLHPRLRVEFNKTKDIIFIFDVYKIIVKFLQFVRYQKNYNLKPVDVFRITEKGDISYIGYLHSKPYITKHCRRHSESDYIYFEPFISQLLQLLSDDQDFSIRHLPLDEDESYKYDTLRYLSVFSAFEYECNKKRREYLNISDRPIKNLKKYLLKEIKAMREKAIIDIEKNFLNNAHNRIAQLGTQYGQEKKIINA